MKRPEANRFRSNSRSKSRKKKKSYLEYLTFQELKNRERMQEVAHLGPGSYFGNEITFGKKSTGVKISPIKSGMMPQENLPGPGMYTTDRSFRAISSRIPEIGFGRPGTSTGGNRHRFSPEGTYQHSANKGGSAAKSYRTTAKKSRRNSPT